MAQAKDDLSPGAKDPAEGARKPDEAVEHEAGPSSQEESHLGAGGDPAEGAD